MFTLLIDSSNKTNQCHLAVFLKVGSQVTTGKIFLLLLKNNYTMFTLLVHHDVLYS